MSELLLIGQSVKGVQSGTEWQVEEFLGAGTQGEVYRVRWGQDEVALKWYFSASATGEQEQRLGRLASRPRPNADFLWPIEVARSPDDVRSFGYLMYLREPRFKSLNDLMSGRIDPSFWVLATAGFRLADAFFQLHSKGLCYRDISFGNAFFDPDTGDVAICDNDNCAVDGEPGGGIVGTPDFMAPEIVRSEAKPSTQTDLYSLAVLLFYLFHIQHPLYGRKILSIHALDLPARRMLCGDEPLFIFDPTDKRNEAVVPDQDPSREAGANALMYWPIYPEFLRRAFIQAFTDGLRDPDHGRVRETEWRKHMIRLRDSIVYCQCGKENFYDAERMKSQAGAGICWQCRRQIHLPFRLRLGKEIVVLRHDSKLYPHHTDPDRPYDFSEQVAEVAIRAAQPSVWGLTNLSTANWTAELPDRSLFDLPPGKSVPLTSGLKINFGTLIGEVRL